MSVVTVVGSVNLDLVFRTPALPKPGETLLGGAFAVHPGGKGANQAAAIAALGGQPEFVGCIGDDSEGALLSDALRKAGVGIGRLAMVQSVRSGTACVLVDGGGTNMIVVAPGANSCVSPAQVTSALGYIKPSVVLAQLEIPIESVLAAAQSEIFILNPAPSHPLPLELLARCTALTPNESELESLTGVRPMEPKDCAQAAKSLLDAGVQNVIVTLGSRGSAWVTESGVQHFPPYSVHAVDTTAAGDAFNGALAHFLAEGREFANAIPLANAVGALSTTKHGAIASMPSLDDVRALAREFV